MTRVLAAILLLLAALRLGGCAAEGPTELRIQPGQYVTAFDAARQALREIDFSLERIDAYNGVITTRQKTTAGLATPWDREQSTHGQDAEDLLNRQARQARVVFEPASGARGPDAGDLRNLPQPLVMRVQVTLFRTQRPGWRLEPTAVRSSSRASDPELAARGMQPTYQTVLDSDRLLAARIVQEVSHRLQQPQR